MTALAVLSLGVAVVMGDSVVGLAVVFDLVVLPRLIASKRFRSGPFMTSFTHGPFPGQLPRDLDAWLGFHRHEEACRIGICVTALATIVLASSVGTFLWLVLTYLVFPLSVRDALRPDEGIPQ
jgi:hypothetical protein